MDEDVDGYSCCKLIDAAHLNKLNSNEISELRTVYNNIFSIDFLTFYSKYLRLAPRHVTINEVINELKEIRVMALLLAHEILKSEKKSFKKSKFGKNFKK